MDNNKMIESIRLLCKNSNISPAKLEEELGFSQGLISRWKDKTPSIDKIVDIADYFHVSLDEVVGYNQSLDDDFITKLYNQTNDGLITWKLVTQDIIDQYPKIRLFDVAVDEYQLYDEEKYNQKHYVTKYNNGYIIMYAFYQYDHLLKPNNLRLFIQPTIESYLVEQDYEQKTLLSLWIKILNCLTDVPDEIKVEEFKNSFINTSNNLSDEKIEIFLENPNIMKLIEIVGTDEFKKVQQIFEDPEFKNSLQVLQKIQTYLNTKHLYLKDVGHH